jgi:hypothetical protein
MEMKQTPPEIAVPPGIAVPPKVAAPPKLALLLLAVTLPRDLREYVAGDLHEEFVHCQRGRWWFWKQTLRSIPALISLVDWTPPVATMLIAGAWIVVGWHLLWVFVLSNVPLKADPATWRMIP